MGVSSRHSGIGACSRQHPKDGKLRKGQVFTERKEKRGEMFRHLNNLMLIKSYDNGDMGRGANSLGDTNCQSRRQSEAYRSSPG